MGNILNGKYPLSISYIITPKDHQSTSIPYSFSNKTSGARYSGVPHKVLVLQGNPSHNLDKPKSINLIWPDLSINTFSGFKSLYIQLLLCK